LIEHQTSTVEEHNEVLNFVVVKSLLILV